MRTNRITLLSLRLAAMSIAGAAVICQGQPTNILYLPPASPDTSSYPSGRDNYTGAVGGSFKVGSSNVIVSHLGYYSLNTSTGLAVSHQVGLFTGGAQTSPPLLSQVVVPSGTTAYWTSNYYWVALNPPLLLSSSTTYTLVGMAGNGDGDPWHDLYSATWNPVFTGATTSGGFGIYGPGSATWPPTSTGNNGANNVYGAPGMANIPIGPALAGVPATNVSFSAGQTVTALGCSSGAQPVTNQWWMATSSNSILISTTTSPYANLVISNSTTNNSGNYYLTSSNALGGAQSSNVTVLVIAVPVSLARQPTNLTVFQNYPATFSAAAAGSPPITYQWYRNGTMIPGATSTNYSLFAADPTNNGDMYMCVASNFTSGTAYTAPTSNAVLTVTYNLAYPQNFLHGYNGGLAINNYSGQVGGQFTTGSHSVLLTHLGYYAWPAATTTNGSSVTCYLTNSAHYVGLYTGNGSELLAYVQIPQGANPVINGYMWQPLDPPLVLTTNTQYLLDAQTFSGSDPWGNVYALSDLNAYFASSCDAIYGGNGWGQTPALGGAFNGDMYSAPNAAILAPATPVAYALPEMGITTNAGFTETLTAFAEGQAPVSVQWYEEPGILLTNQTNLTLTLANMTVAESGSYYVVASNYMTHATGQSADVVVTINPDTSPQIVPGQDIAPSNPVIVQGSSLTFSATFYGSPSFTYGWQLNGNPIPNTARISGANGNVLTINDVQPSDAGNYQLLATNAEGNGGSTITMLTVVPLLPFNNGVGWSSQGNTISWPNNTNVLQLTEGIPSESNSAFSSSAVYIGGFQASFTYQATVIGIITEADGLTFCIQNDPRGAAALGGNGGQLGVGTPPTIMPSFELEFNIYTNNGVGGAGISFDTNGVIGPVASAAQTNVAIGSGDPINSVLTYMNGVATVTLTDTVSNTVYTASTNVNIPAVLGTNVAYVGFTAGTGAGYAMQTVSNFTFVSWPPLSAQASGANLVLSWPAAIGDYMLEQNTNLASTNWTPVATPATVIGTTVEITVPLSGTSSFYELVATNVPGF